MERIRSEIGSIGTLNAGKQRDKILKLLLDWYPRINAFEAKLKPYEAQFKIFRQNEALYRMETERAQVALQRERLDGQSLAMELQEYQEFINSIPPELFEELKQRFEANQQEQDLQL